MTSLADGITIVANNCNLKRILSHMSTRVTTLHLKAILRGYSQRVKTLKLLNRRKGWQLKTLIMRLREFGNNNWFRNQQLSLLMVKNQTPTSVIDLTHQTTGLKEPRNLWEIRTLPKSLIRSRKLKRIKKSLLLKKEKP